MTETLKVNYIRRATRKTGENFDTQEIGGEWEFSIQDGADVDSEYGKALIVLKSSVDGNFSSLEVNDVQTKPEPIKDRLQRQTRELQQSVFTKDEDDQPAETGGSEYRTFASGSTGADIVEGEAVFLENVRVWEVKEDKTPRAGKRFGYLRVGNKETVPSNYARVKSFEPTVINKMLGLKEGDHINLFGHYESWMGRESVQDDPATYMWDFVPERIEKS